MHDAVNLASLVFGLTRFLNCLYPAAGRAALVQRQRQYYMGRNIREGTHVLKQYAVLQKYGIKDNLKKHFCII